MKSENFITIQGWMRNELNLKGNELLLYALIYGFCQDGESKFTGSLKYAAEWLGVSKSTIQVTLSQLIAKELIFKTENLKNSIKFCEYSIIEHHTGNRYTPIPEIGIPPIPVLGTNNNSLDIDNKKDSQWRDNFDVYVAELRQVYSELINNNEFIKQQEELHPGVNIKLSLKKSCLNFWATQAGWRHKKKKRTKELDWKATLVNAIDLNKVYYPRGDDIVSRNLTPKNTGEEYKWSVEER